MEGKAKAEFDDVVIGGSLKHSDERQPDFSGWATKAGIVCSDGRTIMPDAFAHQDATTVPLVWQHNYDEPSNVLGHAVLENRGADGVYAYGYFNGTAPANQAKVLVEHGDIKSLSIFANQLKEQAKKVTHGLIRELSLVLGGANPGALIDNIALSHGDGSVVTLEDEAVIYTGLELEHEDKSGSGGSSNDGPTVQEVFDEMTKQQQDVVHFMVGAALEEAKAEPGGNTPDAAAAAAHTALPTKSKPNPTTQEGRRMTRNVFENGGGSAEEERHALSHDDMKGIAADAVRMGSFKEAVKAYQLKHGIDDIDVLFPDAKAVSNTPEFDKRRTEWVAGVLGGTKKSPFSRIKSLVADLTADEARAKGYIKGNFKKEEWIGLAKRITTPTSFYKKQKLDRDDIIDVTDIDVVTWLWGEMRLMLDEELARAILIGDGRAIDDEDKIRDPAGANEAAGIRSILHDHDLYAGTVTIGPETNLDTSEGRLAVVEQIMQDMRLYKGSGSPAFYTTIETLNKLLLAKDGMNRRYWRTASELATEMGVDRIVTVEVMDEEPDLVGIIVNLTDYTVGTDRGGEIAKFDDFDIDYNQYKYLLEGRCSGALTKIRAALVVKFSDAGAVEVVPAEPGFDVATGVVTIPVDANVNYRNADTGAALVDGPQAALNPGEGIIIEAIPTAGHYFDNNVEDQWAFERPAV